MNISAQSKITAPILIKKVVKLVPMREFTDLSVCVFSDGTEGLGVYAEARRGDLMVVLPSALIYRDWFFDILTKYVKHDSFGVAIKHFPPLVGRKDLEDGQDVTALLTEISREG